MYKRQVLEATKQYFEENLSKEKIAERMNNLIAYEKHKILKWAPLELKNRCLLYTSLGILAAIFLICL